MSRVFTYEQKSDSYREKNLCFLTQWLVSAGRQASNLWFATSLPEPETRELEPQTQPADVTSEPEPGQRLGTEHNSAFCESSWKYSGVSEAPWLLASVSGSDGWGLELAAGWVLCWAPAKVRWATSALTLDEGKNTFTYSVKSVHLLRPWGMRCIAASCPTNELGIRNCNCLSEQWWTHL